MDGYSQPVSSVSLETSPLTMAAILYAVSSAYNVSIPLLKGPIRQRWIAWPRQTFCWLAYNTGQWSTPQIAHFLGDRDHTTILYGVTAVNKRHAAAIGDCDKARKIAADFGIPEARPSVCPTCGQKVN